MIISSPMNESELRNLMYTAQLDTLAYPMVIRYPRGEGVMPVWRTPFKEIEIGKGIQIKEGKEIAILTLGNIGNQALKACDMLQEHGIQPALFDMRFAKPLDEALLHEIFTNYTKIVTVEDSALQGGFGSAIAEFAVDHQYSNPITRLGIPDQVIEHGEQIELYKLCGIDAESIANKIVLFKENIRTFAP